MLVRVLTDDLGSDVLRELESKDSSERVEAYAAGRECFGLIAKRTGRTLSDKSKRAIGNLMLRLLSLLLGGEQAMWPVLHQTRRFQHALQPDKRSAQ